MQFFRNWLPKREICLIQSAQSFASCKIEDINWKVGMDFNGFFHGSHVNLIKSYYMRIVLLIATVFTLVSCNKDEFTDEPQIKFLRFDANQASNFTQLANQPHIFLEVTDANGDLGFKPGEDTAIIYLKNVFTNFIDSTLYFPDLGSSAKKNFKAEIRIGLFSVLGGRDLPFNQRPYSDTLFFEVYIKDFAKNKSNVLITPEPFIFHTLP